MRIFSTYYTATTAAAVLLDVTDAFLLLPGNFLEILKGKCTLQKWLRNLCN